MMKVSPPRILPTRGRLSYRPVVSTPRFRL
jgi:hypothetical protein